LESWHWLDVKKRQLEHQIVRCEDRIARLRADLAASTQRAITYDKDRVQGGVQYDATAESHIRYSKTRIYEILEETAAAMEGGLWQ
jgi:hypothetical protein